jgi:hypothetical protein
VNDTPAEPPPLDERLRLVYTEALRGITQQQQVLDNLRGRSAVLLSAGAVATSFLAGYAVPSRSGPAVVIAVVAAVLFVAVVVLTLWTLWPRKFKFRNEPQKLLREWVDSEHGHYSLDAMHRYLAEWFGEHYDQNQKKIDSMLADFTVACGCLGLEIVLLLVLALTKGK